MDFSEGRFEAALDRADQVSWLIAQPSRFALPVRVPSGRNAILAVKGRRFATVKAFFLGYHPRSVGDASTTSRSLW